MVTQSWITTSLKPIAVGGVRPKATSPTQINAKVMITKILVQ